MKIEFNDGSFLEIEELDGGQVRVVLGAIKSYNSSTMLAADLDEKQASAVASFFVNLGREKST